MRGWRDPRPVPAWDGAAQAGARDRRALAVPGVDGRPGFAGDPPVVGVVGGGIAGVAAATVLAERGARVVVYERQACLGGRLAGWPVRLADGSRATMSRGFHAFFRQYYNLRGLLRRVDDTLGMLTPLPDYPLRHRDGWCGSFRDVPRTPPWNAVAFVARSGAFTWRDVTRVRARTALSLLDVRVPRVYRRFDATSAQDYLDAIGFPPAARHLAFEVFSRSFFADPAELSAAELLLMFHIYFLGSSEGLLFDVPRQPYPEALWEPLARHLARHGAEVRTSTPVREVRPRAGGGLTVASPGGDDDVDAVVLALDTAGLRALVRNSPGLGDAPWRESIDRLRTASPFLVSRLWLRRPVAADRPGFLGTSGYGSLDNVSVLERWDGEAARWATRTGGSVVELHAYAVTGTDRRSEQQRLLAQLGEVYPETRGAEVVDVRHLWRADCPLFDVGGYARRPGVRTPDPRVVLAGDLVSSRLPVALMERAATTGIEAANALLERWGVRGHTLWTVPVAGRSAALRALAALA